MEIDSQEIERPQTGLAWALAVGAMRCSLSVVTAAGHLRHRNGRGSWGVRGRIPGDAEPSSLKAWNGRMEG